MSSGLRYFANRIAYKLWFVNFSNVFTRMKLMFWGIKFGRKVRLYGPITIIKHPGSQIEIGDNVLLQSRNRKYALNLHSCVKFVTFKGTSRIKIGDNCDLNGTVVACRSTSIEIGSGTIIAANCTIMDTDWHVTVPIDRRTGVDAIEVSSDRPVLIKENVWIGANCMILKGVTIGQGSVIAAGSVVTKDVPEMVIAGGVPAKTLRELVV